MSMASKCPFCNSEIISNTFLESANFRAVYNIAPILPGHSMIIPKIHTESIMQLSDEMMSEMMSLAKKTAKILEKAFLTPFFNYSIQEGVVAGQTVMHLHLHIVPRTKDDMINTGDWYPKIENSDKNIYLDSDKRGKLSKQEISNIVTYLQNLK